MGLPVAASLSLPLAFAKHCNNCQAYALLLTAWQYGDRHLLTCSGVHSLSRLRALCVSRTFVIHIKLRSLQPSELLAPLYHHPSKDQHGGRGYHSVPQQLPTLTPSAYDMTASLALCFVSLTRCRHDCRCLRAAGDDRATKS